MWSCNVNSVMGRFGRWMFSRRLLSLPHDYGSIFFHIQFSMHFGMCSVLGSEKDFINILYFFLYLCILISAEIPQAPQKKGTHQHQRQQCQRQKCAKSEALPQAEWWPLSFMNSNKTLINPLCTQHGEDIQAKASVLEGVLAPACIWTELEVLHQTQYRLYHCFPPFNLIVWLVDYQH